MENRIDKKTDEATDKVLDKAEGSVKKSGKKNKQGQQDAEGKRLKPMKTRMKMLLPKVKLLRNSDRSVPTILFRVIKSSFRRFQQDAIGDFSGTMDHQQRR